MAIDHLEEIRELPYDEDACVAGGERLARYIYILIERLATGELYEIQRRVNAILDTNSIQYQYYASPDPQTGEYPAGTWRQGVNDDGQFVKENYNNGIWVAVTIDDA